MTFLNLEKITCQVPIFSCKIAVKEVLIAAAQSTVSCYIIRTTIIVLRDDHGNIITMNNPPIIFQLTRNVHF